jgi:hypothetical protein
MRLSDPPSVLGLVAERFGCQKWVLCGFRWDHRLVRFRCPLGKLAEEFDRETSSSPRLKPTLPKIGFLERHDLSKL